MEQQKFYRLFVWTTKLEDLFKKPGGILNEFGIKKGDVVVDYGCGPGRYLKTASKLVGERGLVIAADISSIAIRYAENRIKRDGLRNVETVLISGGKGRIADQSADIIYALDMFHGIEEPEAFLKELFRIVKPGGVLYLEDGHQSRMTTKQKIGQSALWKLDRESGGYVVLKPNVSA